MPPGLTKLLRALRGLAPLDLALFAVALLLGSVSLAYPYCRDQGLFQYVGRQWFLEGQLPYRDVFDHKTPFIYIVNGIFVLLFGEGIMPVRVSELLLVLSIGPLALRATGVPARPGVVGLTVLATVAFYFGYLPYPDTGNCEVWAVVMLLGALCLVKYERGPRAVAVAGALTGLAFVAKPPAGLFIAAVGVALLLGRETWRERVRAGAILVGGFVAPIALVLVYFAAKGGLSDLYDVVVSLNRYYVQSEGVVFTGMEAVRKLLDGVLWFAPFGSLFFIVSATLVALGLASRNKALALRYSEPLLYGVLALGAVWMQRKFFVYHYTFVIFGFAMFSARAFEDVLGRLAANVSPRAPAAALAVALLTLQHTGGAPIREYERRLGDLLDYKTGAIDRDTYERRFDIPGFYDNGNVMLVSRWLAEHTRASGRRA
jgi:4-amino-4-deoxy-L-arabinose transferase-like glycosyltransferase